MIRTRSSVTIWRPPDEGAAALAAYLHDLARAKKTIRIMDYVWRHPDIISAVLLAHKRGVDCKLLLDAGEVEVVEPGPLNTPYQPGMRKLQTMVMFGFPVANLMVTTSTHDSLMHTKDTSIDGVTLWTGSTNSSLSGWKYQENVAIRIASKTACADMETRFVLLWAWALKNVAQPVLT